MFHNLLKMYKRHSLKTPLEDFTTESFAGLLELEPKLKKSFTEFLKLDDAEYSITTQKSYSIPSADPNCLVDMVLESDTMVCFIENKVNSKEGYKQLPRYALALDQIALTGKKTRLIYCTKYYDSKTLNEHDFRQIRWFEIASKVLLPRNNIPVVKDFFNFLKINRMAQELTFTALDFATMQNMQEVLMIMNGHQQKTDALFQDMFTAPKLDDKQRVKDVMIYNRFVTISKNILGAEGYSELKFGFNFDMPSIYVGIWVDISHPRYKAYKEAIDSRNPEFSVTHREHGSAIEKSRDLSDLLNRKDVDDAISKWFKQAFEDFGKFITETKAEMNWQISPKPIAPSPPLYVLANGSD